MKAAQYNQYGGPEVIEINQSAPEPKTGEGQILVDVYAAGINPIDYKLREGYMKEHLPLTFPVTINGDYSGVVKEIAEGVTEFKIGDEVYGQAGVYNGGSGSTAEFATANVANSGLKPKAISHEEAAALPITGASAVQALEEHINLQSGQKILINGGAGGIGTLAIQIAKSMHAYVAVTAGTDDVEYVKNLKADEVIDYKRSLPSSDGKTEDFLQNLKDYDAVLDMVGGETAGKLFDVLKKGGVIVSMVGQPDIELAKKHEVIAIGQGTKTNTEHLKKLAELIDNGIIKPNVDKVFPLDKTKDAFEYLEKESARGKVVIKIKD